jgi:hypothetical protein
MMELSSHEEMHRETCRFGLYSPPNYFTQASHQSCSQLNTTDSRSNSKDLRGKRTFRVHAYDAVDAAIIQYGR